MVKDNFTIKELLMENREDTKQLLSDMATVREHLSTLNGRVGKTEKHVDGLRASRWKLGGALAVISIIIPILVSFLIR